MQSLIRDVLQTLRGEPGANSVVHLQTNFGGGKTHAELALYHLITSPEEALAVPQAAVAALPCADLYAGGREVEGKDGASPIHIRTLWGEIAYRPGAVGGQRSAVELYQLIRDSDQQQLAPGVAQLLQARL